VTVTADELKGALNDATNKLAVLAYEHEGDEPLSRREICEALKRKVEGIVETCEHASKRKFRVAMLGLAAYAILAAADSDKKK
jgi:hypothetical protein